MQDSIIYDRHKVEPNDIYLSIKHTDIVGLIGYNESITNRVLTYTQNLFIFDDNHTHEKIYKDYDIEDILPRCDYVFVMKDMLIDNRFKNVINMITIENNEIRIIYY